MSIWRKVFQIKVIGVLKFSGRSGKFKKRKGDLCGWSQVVRVKIEGDEKLEWWERSCIFIFYSFFSHTDFVGSNSRNTRKLSCHMEF